MAAVWYATLEEVKAALNSKETARNNDQLRRLIEAATDSIECDQLRRRFYPDVTVHEYDWPNRADRDDEVRTLSLGQYELIELDELSVAGVPVAGADVTPIPAEGPPYPAVELDTDVTLPLATPRRRAVQVSGTFGYSAMVAPAGTLGAAVADGSVTSVTVSNSAAIGTGQLLLVESERMIVDQRSMVDTGQDLAGNLDKATNAEVVSVGSGAAFAEGEVVMVDAEKMLVVEIAGDNLIVKRAWDGSTLAAHTSGADVFAPRKLTVRRGVLGTTAAAHGNGSAVAKHVFPKLVNQLCIAETLTAFMQENSGYARTIGTGDSSRDDTGVGLVDLRERAWQAYGRKAW